MSVVSTIRGLREMSLADENVKRCIFCEHWTTKGPESARQENGPGEIVECHVCGAEAHIQCGGWREMPKVPVCSKECQRQFAAGAPHHSSPRNAPAQ